MFMFMFVLMILSRSYSCTFYMNMNMDLVMDKGKDLETDMETDMDMDTQKFVFGVSDISKKFIPNSNIASDSNLFSPISKAQSDIVHHGYRTKCPPMIAGDIL
jgi:hypothetical protein